MKIKRDILGNIINDLPSATRLKSGFNMDNEADKKVRKFLDKIKIRREDIKETTFQVIKNLKDFYLPLRGEQIRIRTQTQLNLISVILKLVHYHSRIEELTITTYTLYKESFEILIKFLKNGQIEKLNLFLTSSYSFRSPEYYSYLKDICKSLSSSYNISLIFAWSHFKITLAKCGFEHYQLEGSMNYSTNNMAEQILFCNDKEVYEFDYDFIKSISKNKTNKALEIIC